MLKFFVAEIVSCREPLLPLDVAGCNFLTGTTFPLAPLNLSTVVVARQRHSSNNYNLYTNFYLIIDKISIYTFIDYFYRHTQHSA